MVRLVNILALSFIAPLTYSFECVNNNDCSVFEACTNNICVGLIPDIHDEKLIRCADGYKCKIDKEIPGYGVNEKFKIMAILPDQHCGTSDVVSKDCKLLFTKDYR